MHCDDCNGRKFTEEGAKLFFSGEKISNPLGDNCDSEPAFSGIKPARAASLLAGPGKRWPVEIRHGLAGNSNLHYGFVTCGGLNYMQLLVLSPRQMLYFFEGGEVFTLIRSE